MAITDTYCPLCGEPAPQLGRRLPYAFIWQELATRGVRFAEATRRANTPADHTVEARCRQCDLIFFVPLVPGDQAFYEELMEGDPYLAYRWDFSVGAALVDRRDHLLDVGCGEGAFLRLVRHRAARVVGLDLNASAVARLQAEGIEVHAGELEAFAATHEGHFDLVTSYQTLEHLGEIDAFARAAARCLRPGGSLVVSVPNRERRHREPFEVLDLPPHHMTRWSPDQLRELGRRVGLSLDWVRIQPAGRLHLSALYGPRVAGALGPRSLAVARRAGFAGSVALLRYFGGAAERRRADRGGHSLVARFRCAPA